MTSYSALTNDKLATDDREVCTRIRLLHSQTIRNTALIRRCLQRRDQHTITTCAERPGYKRRTSDWRSKRARYDGDC
jgi:hypothetical protein